MTPDLERLSRQVKLPTPAGVAMHIIDLAQDPDIGLDKVARAVSLDPALTMKILKAANSPLYVQRRRCESLPQALVVLGLNATLTLALSFTLTTTLRSQKPRSIDYPRYWRRALIAAISARAMGESLHQPHAEELFLAGLLQDVGILVLDQVMPELYRDAAPLLHDHRSLAGYEIRHLHEDHASIGGSLLKSWHLPERLCHAIRASHTLEQHRAESSDAIFDRCVALSGPVSDLFVNKPMESELAQTAHAVERSLGIDKQQFAGLLGTIGGLIPDVEALFDTDIRSGTDAERLLEQARELLMLRHLQPRRVRSS